MMISSRESGSRHPCDFTVSPLQNLPDSDNSSIEQIGQVTQVEFRLYCLISLTNSVNNTKPQDLLMGSLKWDQ